MVYSAMQFVHGFIYKDKPAIKSGIKTFFLAVILLLPRLSYQHFRIDGADYKKSVKKSLSSIDTIYKDDGISDAASLKDQIEALSQRLAADDYQVELQSSVEQENGENYTLRNLSAIKSAAIPDSADIILISTALDSEDFSYAADISVIESLADKLSTYDSSIEIRFLVSMDGREGQDAAQYYIDSLDASVLDRIICNIDFDMQSLADYTGLLGFTVNGRKNPVSDAITTSVKRMTGQALEIKQNKECEYISFHLNGIPTVYLEQATVEDSSAARSIDDLDVDQISDVAAVLGDTIIPLVRNGSSELTEALTSDTRNIYCSGAFQKDKDTFIKGNSLKEISEAFGTALTKTEQQDSYGNDLYSGRLYILTFDDAVNVLFHITDGKLSRISIDTGDVPVSKDELTQILNNLYGDYQKEDDEIIWTDAGSKAIYSISGAESKNAIDSMTSGGYSFNISSS